MAYLILRGSTQDYVVHQNKNIALLFSSFLLLQQFRDDIRFPLGKKKAWVPILHHELVNNGVARRASNKRDD